MADKYVYRTFHDGSLSLNGKALLVTGGTGSFGKAFVDTILNNFKPRRLVVFSRDEFKQSEMAELYPSDKHPALRFFIGDVRDRARLEMAMLDIDIVVHAAALKQVPVAEYNPFECINTNVVGAENVVQAAIRSKVSKVLALSTDKAVNPVNLYGASKLAADKLFVAANNLSGSAKSQFSIARYGNVIGSRGSVIPLFQRLQRENKKTLPITHPDMSRFWINLRQGVDFVLSSISLMQGGEIFVPRLPSMRIVDIANVIAPELKHEKLGIRPGEKLHEILITREDAPNTVILSDRFIILPSFSMWRQEAFEYPDIVAESAPQNFQYSSDNNTEWLNEESLIELMENA